MIFSRIAYLHFTSIRRNREAKIALIVLVIIHLQVAIVCGKYITHEYYYDNLGVLRSIFYWHDY